MMWLKDIFSGLVSPVVDLIDHSKERKHQERLGELGAIKAKWAGTHALIKAGQAHLANWEMASLKNSGWKDEFVLVVMYFPVISLFATNWDNISVAVNQLKNFPEWYTTTLMVITFAIYGIRLSLPAASALFNRGKKK